MATLAKKIRMKNSSGAVQTALIYSTTGESGEPNLPLTVDGVQGYACLAGTSDTRATSGRVKTSGGTQYAIGARGVPAYGYGHYTSNGSFTVPAGVTVLRVTCVGGGAGGMLERDCDDFSSTGTYTLSGVEGGATNFGTVVANGATSSVYSIHATVSDDGEGHKYVDCYNTSITNSNGTQNGMTTTNGTNHTVGYQGGAAVSLTMINGTLSGSAGAGGGVTVAQRARICTGGSGYKTTQNISVTPGQVISYSIGSGGKCRDWGGLYATSYNDGHHGVAYPGSNGAVLVEWGEGIQ